MRQEVEDDCQSCQQCGDHVYTLSSRFWCDGCEEESDQAQVPGMTDSPIEYAAPATGTLTTQGPVLRMDGVEIHAIRAEDGAVVVWIDTDGDEQLTRLRVNVNDDGVFGYAQKWSAER